MKKWREIAIVFLVAALVPIARASVLPSNCTQLGGDARQDCQNILGDSSLSLAEKEDLYINLVANQGKLPAHDFAWNWNNNLSWASPPSSVAPASNGIIKNAWVKVVAVGKSFFDLNVQQWFFAPSGRMLVEKKHSIELPTTPLEGDCRTEYDFELLEDSLNVRLNGTQIGNARISNYSAVAGDAVFSADGVVRARLLMHRYHSVTNCFLPEWWWTCVTSCAPYRTDERIDSVSASDSFSGKVRSEDPGFELHLEKGLLNKVFLRIDADEPINFFELHVGSNYFGFGESIFDLNSVDGVVFVTRNNSLQKELQGLLELDSNVEARRFVFGSPLVEDCSVKLFSSFEERDLPCDLVELKPVVLGVETDANSLDFNQQVGVNIKLADAAGIPLANKKIVLRAGEESQELITDSEGTARTSALPGNGVILAEVPADSEFASGSAVKRVALLDSGSFGATEKLAGFFGAYYFIFLIAKKLWVGC